MIKLIAGALLLDFLLGDPHWLPHPVVLMGRLILRLEGLLRRVFKSSTGQYFAGVIMVLVTVGSAFFITWQLIFWAFRLNSYLGWTVHLLLLFTTLAVRSLHQHALAVAEPLAKGNIAEARRQLAKIVGRDTDNLSPREVSRGAVETVAENTVDGIISPLFYAFIGGAPLAMAYKAVNTLDSMIGYRDERYARLGWAAARLDDIANYLPARITGLIFLLISPFTPGGFKGTYTALRRDAAKHPSPNSGIPEAAVAGALKVQLGGTNYYRGVASHRALMGENLEALGVQHIHRAVKLMYAVTAAAAGLGWAVTIIIRGV
ncbi:adenosylcobinamide-phosphate synthase [Desulfohalotomaculum tongense]|uniref:adenosylcobinamide-phosphate synthase CbiB n=1 Tax=Desulforadius tongensis TaxID=1216062 RepID=UPI00195C47A3|nr:adenosylcobinamide-phosphate synthase CbiB [Desulforadius tongensis]MBM7854335.1 adenosylcobinamide-phosphate synthase [Desulforadius tongensis]